MKLRLYNTLTRRIDDFIPQDPQRVTMYLCGPTVYDYVHIGNARGPVVFGLLVRLLKRVFGGQQVVFARNITDVDDKINAAAKEAGVPIDQITTRFANVYAEDLHKLGVDRPDIVPYATAHIGQIIAMCEQLIANGHAYAAQGHVLFDVASYPDYGHLSGRSTEDMIAGARVEVAPYKKNPADFVLWKPSTPDLPGWDSPWGRGRPGWHIECSAMAQAHLGETIDIHAGGNDLMFPHHENEVAQSTCAHGGKIFARWWVHNGMLTMDGRKMSKSLGNTMKLHDLLQKHSPDLLRLLLIKAHYRQPLDWSQSAIEQAQRTLDGLYGVLRELSDVAVDAEELSLPDDFIATLADDLNTPEALAALSRLADDARKAKNPQDKKAAKAALLGAGQFLGLLQVNPESWFRDATAGSGIDTDSVQQLVDARQAAKLAKNYAESDRLRDQLLALGIVVEDTPQGPRWKRANPSSAVDECAS